MNTLLKKGWKVWEFFLFMSFLTGWNVPNHYQSFEKPMSQNLELDYGIVEVNGEAKIVANGEELSYVRGDQIKIKNAFLKKSDTKIGTGNIFGFINSLGTLDDRSQSLDTSRQLTRKQWSVDNDGRVFAVVVSTGKTLHGAFFLRRIEPSLSYIDVLINGSSKVMREGEQITVKKTDKVEVKKFMTNIQDNKNVTFAFVPISSQKDNPFGAKDFQIVFKCNSFEFARIAMTVENQ